MAVEGQRDAMNAAIIPRIRTLADSKLGVISIGDRPPWKSIGAPSSLVFCTMAKRFIMKRGENTTYL
ncbi:hypothetical protein BHE74_00050988 [Ensete ventricosum]|nr:hypothetical protein GW17_00029275 [Ensete ventricosum]RWW43366.1 hypothetical protein BHE74_00050988 [Ensete ventricosum]RZR84552.1 hypothetical protein BHM03_00011399 [Ensete ventricosum]